MRIKNKINKLKNDNKDDLNEVIKILKNKEVELKQQLTVTEKERKSLKRKSMLMEQERLQNDARTARDKELGLLSDKDMQLLTMARDKLKTKMLNLENLLLQLANLNEEEATLLSHDISMKPLLAYTVDA